MYSKNIVLFPLFISDILSKFSKTQRITVLLILIVSLIILTLGPKTISTFSPDSKESQVILKQQDTQIKNLSGQIDSCNIKITQLNKQIIQNQQQCTDNIVKREQEIWKEIDLLETQMKTKSKPVFKMNAEEATYKSINNELKINVYFPYSII